MRNLFRKLLSYWLIRKAHRELDKAIILAEYLFRTNNRRYYVLPDTKHRLHVLSWSQIKQMRAQGIFSGQAKEIDFIRESFYYTPSKIEKEYMKPETKDRKRNLWIEYFKAYRID